MCAYVRVCMCMYVCMCIYIKFCFIDNNVWNRISHSIIIYQDEISNDNNHNCFL